MSGPAIVRAVAWIREELEGHKREPLRGSLILRSEFSHEIIRRILRHYLRTIAPSPDVYEQMPFQDLIRSANAQGLLATDWPVWRRYRDMRARTSHTYSAAVAEQTASV